MHTLARSRCRTRISNVSKNGEEMLSAPKKKKLTTRIIGVSRAQKSVRGEALVFRCIISYNARYVKYREVKKPSFPVLGAFGGQPVLRLAKSRFSGLAAIYLFLLFYILLL